jgi:hypothetical protein
LSETKDATSGMEALRKVGGTKNLRMIDEPETDEHCLVPNRQNYCPRFTSPEIMSSATFDLDRKRFAPTIYHEQAPVV